MTECLVPGVLFLAFLVFCALGVFKSFVWIVDLGWMLRRDGGRKWATTVENALLAGDDDAFRDALKAVRERPHVYEYGFGPRTRWRNALLFLTTMPAVVGGVTALGYLLAAPLAWAIGGGVVVTCIGLQAVFFPIVRFVLGSSDNYYHARFGEPLTVANTMVDWRVRERYVIQEFAKRFLGIFGSTVYGFGFLHFVLALAVPSGYKLPPDISNHLMGALLGSVSSSAAGMIDFTYFSLVVITTTGFGEMHPAHWLTRIATVSEISLNLLLVVLLLAVVMAGLTSGSSGRASRAAEP